MSPSLAALLRQHPAQWAAAGDALAAVARRAAARSFIPRLDTHARARAHTTAGFGEVWAVAARASPPPGCSHPPGVPPPPSRARLRGTRAIRRRRVREPPRAIRAVRPRTPRARRRPRAETSPTFPASSSCCSSAGADSRPRRRSASRDARRDGADEGKRDRSSADEGSRSIGRVLVPANGAERSWMDGVSPSFRDLVERALTALRALHLSVLFAPAVALAPLLLYAGGDAGAALWYRLLRRTLELGGAAFIKWGQWASTRYDVFPAQLCRELEELQASAPEHSWRRTKQILERAYGAEQVEEIFVWMDPRPIASGSIAQIHRAKLKIGVAEANGGGPELGFQQRLLRSAQAGSGAPRERRVATGGILRHGGVETERGKVGVESGQFHRLRRPIRRRRRGVREDGDGPGPVVDGVETKSETETARRGFEARRFPPARGTRGRRGGGSVRGGEGASSGRGGRASSRFRHLDVVGDGDAGRLVFCSRSNWNTPCSSSACTCSSRWISPRRRATCASSRTVFRCGPRCPSRRRCRASPRRRCSSRRSRTASASAIFSWTRSSGGDGRTHQTPRGGGARRRRAQHHGNHRRRRRRTRHPGIG